MNQLRIRYRTVYFTCMEPFIQRCQKTNIFSIFSQPVVDKNKFLNDVMTEWRKDIVDTDII